MLCSEVRPKKSSSCIRLNTQSKAGAMVGIYHTHLSFAIDALSRHHGMTKTHTRQVCDRSLARTTYPLQSILFYFMMTCNTTLCKSDEHVAHTKPTICNPCFFMSRLHETNLTTLWEESSTHRHIMSSATYTFSSHDDMQKSPHIYDAHLACNAHIIYNSCFFMSWWDGKQHTTKLWQGSSTDTYMKKTHFDWHLAQHTTI